MRIPGQRICGLPAVKLRDFLRERGDSWSAAYFSERLGLSPEEGLKSLSCLESEGYIESESGPTGEVWYRTTLQGNALSLASAAKPLRRSSAEAAVRSFLERVHEINSSEHYLYRVTRVVAFGSYLTDKEYLNDVDLAVELVPKNQDPDEHLRLMKKRAREARESGRSFSSFLDELGWGYTEVLMRLKNRSRTVGLHTTDDPILSTTETRLLFEDASKESRG